MTPYSIPSSGCSVVIWNEPTESQELRQLYLSALSGKRALVVLDDGGYLDQSAPCFLLRAAD